VQTLACRWERFMGASGGTPYCDRPGVRYAMYAAYRRGGLPGALAQYDSLEQQAPDGFTFGPAQLVSFSYDLRRAGRTEDARRGFEASVRRYPDDWNSHDSLGEVLLAAGDTVHAIQEYRRSVELNPSNANGVAVLRSLQAK